jgi:Indole-3-glycerol phosphate synthase
VVTESGILKQEDVKLMRGHEVHAFLVGEFYACRGLRGGVGQGVYIGMSMELSVSGPKNLCLVTLFESFEQLLYLSM